MWRSPFSLAHSMSTCRTIIQASNGGNWHCQLCTEDKEIMLCRLGSAGVQCCFSQSETVPEPKCSFLASHFARPFVLLVTAFGAYNSKNCINCT